MRLLILGGTKFVGRHLVEAALERGHEVTLFNRGQTNPGLFPQVESIRGDRQESHAVLVGREFDVTIDTSGYLPRVVADSVEALGEGAGHYVFVSSISVYADFSQAGIDESSPVAELDDPSTEDIGEHYGALKVACERVVQKRYGDKSLIVRPGLIVGPHDPTNRFTYWVTRIAGGGTVLAPAPAGAPCQFIDVRDLASWMLALAENRVAGVYNATGPVPTPTFAELLDGCARTAGSAPTIEWVDPQFLLDAGVEPWEELPLWSPGEEMAGILKVDVSRAVAAGLTFRPLEETTGDTLRWAREEASAGPAPPPGVPREAGMDPEREAKLLEEWSALRARG